MYDIHMAKQRYNQYLEVRQVATFESLRDHTGITVSELMRRMFDYCFQESVMNQIVPCMSGQLKTNH